jgi:Flp pilus assembly protein TadG
MKRTCGLANPFRYGRIIRVSGVMFSGRSGVAAIELALVSPLLLILLTGIVEIGIAGFQAMQVQAAVQAGAMYAVQNGSDGLTAIELTAIGTAVVNATGTAGITAAPAPFTFCGCPATTGVISQMTDCTTVCAGNNAPGHYVKISAALPHATLMPYLNLPLPASLTASTTIRIQ